MLAVLPLLPVDYGTSLLWRYTMKAALSAFVLAAVAAPAIAGVLVSSNGNPVKTAGMATCVRVMGSDVPTEFFVACGVEVPATK